MANEITANQSLTLAKGTSKATLSAGSFSVTVSGTTYIQEIASIAITDTVLNLGAVSSIGYVVFHNLDLTNYVTIGSDGAVYPVKLKAGEWAMLRWNGAAIHALANTSACNLEYLLISD